MGHGNACVVILSHPTVAAEHAQIVPRDGTFWLEDLGTAHGSFVNELRISKHALKRGDWIHLGECSTQIEVVECDDWIRLALDEADVVMVRTARAVVRADVGTETDAGAIIAGIAFGDRGEARQLKWAGIAALLAHFAMFAALLPVSAGPDLFELEDNAVVIRRYQPPEPPKPQRVVRRRTVQRIPIPDPTPDAPEVIMDLEPPELGDLEEVDTDFTDLPLAGFGPPPGPAAVEMTAEGLVPPGLLERVDPEYDRTRARRGIQGRADIEIIIDEAGAVIFSRLINSTTDEELDSAALEAIRQWRFSAATLDGEEVRVRAVVTINFRIY